MNASNAIMPQPGVSSSPSPDTIGVSSSPSPDTALALQRLEQLHRSFFGSEGDGFVLASVPGRIELAGNHTDHQGGHTISAGLNRRIYGLARPNGKDVIRVWMEGFGEGSVNLDNLGPIPAEANSSTALIRGMAAAYKRNGGQPVGFDAVVLSDIPVGSGVSSSAAFEVLVGALIREISPTGWLGSATLPETSNPAAPPNSLHDGHVATASIADSAEAPGSAKPEARPSCTNTEPTPAQLVQLALDGQFAEGDYFGKPTGAQDQLACAFGGIVALDFSTHPPTIAPIAANFEQGGFALMLIDSRCDHSQYTSQFNAVPSDMRRVAALFDEDRLLEVGLPRLLEHLANVRSTVGDLATMRAIHFFTEDQRVQRQTVALQEGKFQAFARMARESGTSSAMFLQNVSPKGEGCDALQPAMAIQALCAALLGEEGAWRIHGGGFGGSVLAIVPQSHARAFATTMNQALGYEACSPIAIDPQGLKVQRI